MQGVTPCTSTSTSACPATATATAAAAMTTAASPTEFSRECDGRGARTRKGKRMTNSLACIATPCCPTAINLPTARIQHQGGECGAIWLLLLSLLVLLKH